MNKGNRSDEEVIAQRDDGGVCKRLDENLSESLL